MKNTMHKYFSIILAIALMSTLLLPVDFVYASDGISSVNIAEVHEGEFLSEADRDLAFESLSQLLELQDYKRFAISHNIETDMNLDLTINKLESEIDSMSINELTDDQMRQVLNLESGISTCASTPSVPSNKTNVKFYSMSSKVTVDNKEYKVFEIVAHGTGVNDGSLSVDKTVNLLSKDSYALSVLKEKVNFLSSVLGAISMEWSALDYISSTANYFNTSCSQKLMDDYAATKTIDYAYVAQGNSSYVHMQTSEYIYLENFLYAQSWSPSGARKTEYEGNVSVKVKSKNYAKISPPAKRYAAGEREIAQYRVGTISIKYGSKTKAKVSLGNYRTLDSVPGAI